MKRSIVFLVAALMVGSLTVAVQAFGSPAVDPDSAFTVRGAVVAFLAASGAGHPALTVDDAQLGRLELALGPVWYLSAEGFSAEVGDEVEALAYDCPVCSLDAVAGRVDNLDTGTSVHLRGDDGTPLWLARGRRGNRQAGVAGEGWRGGGAGVAGKGAGGQGSCGGSGLDMAAATSAMGTVVSFDGRPGDGMPVLVLGTGSGELEITVGPYRVLAASGLSLAEGVELEVVYAPAAGTDHLVAISITDLATGVTVQLRDPETGFPLAGGRWGSRARGQGRAR